MLRNGCGLVIDPQNTLTPNKCQNLFPYEKIENHLKTDIYTTGVYKNLQQLLLNPDLLPIST